MDRLVKLYLIKIKMRIFVDKNLLVKGRRIKFSGLNR